MVFNLQGVKSEVGISYFWWCHTLPLPHLALGTCQLLAEPTLCSLCVRTCNFHQKQDQALCSTAPVPVRNVKCGIKHHLLSRVVC